MTQSSPFCDRLKQARQKRKISQKQLGIAAGIDPGSASPRINQYERGKHTPDFLTVERLAAALTTPVPYFYTSDDLMAELILLIHELDECKKQKLIRQLLEKAQSGESKSAG